MSESDQLQELLQRVAALEAREKSLTAASNAYQAIITTLLGNLDKQERDKIIAMIDQAHEIAYARAIQRCNESQKQKIKQADDIAQRMFMFAQGKNSLQR
ncbi:MAG: sigma-S stabilization anti-adapter protein IraP [Serratia inhibens]|uniref:sigma-S stabilization anti-adapter protein IraP n=1 Tax=Serratia inhibens TaxID=2338073 RepID=UPI003C797448